MKELSVEEKANAYDKVRGKIALRFGSNVAEDIFSEFELSEDEKIKKAIINIFATHKDYEVYFGVSVKDIRVWLEKQGEQKPIDKVEPKFKVGDKLVSTKNPRLTYEVLKVGNVNELGNLEYEIEIFTDGKPGIQFGDTFKEHNIHLMECVKVDEWAKLVDEAKPKWSEEDTFKYRTLIDSIADGRVIRKELRCEFVFWLESLKKRMEK